MDTLTKSGHLESGNAQDVVSQAKKNTVSSATSKSAKETAKSAKEAK